MTHPKTFTTSIDGKMNNKGISSVTSISAMISENHATGYSPLVLPEINIDHVIALTDDTGIFQHAVFSIPDYREGYTTDDNARAVLLSVMLESVPGETPLQINKYAPRYLGMLWYAYNPETGRFRNFLPYNRVWKETAGSEDSHGRALMALGTVLGRSQSEERCGIAERLFHIALPVVLGFTSPRAWAFTLLGINEYLKRFPDNALVKATGEILAKRLLALYLATSSPEWQWFENIVTYANPRLSQALIVSGIWLSHTEMINAGLTSLEWLAAIQRSESGNFSPIGSNGFYKRNGIPAHFDQQPIEAFSMISACLDAYQFTREHRWKEEAQRTFGWFLGLNDLGMPLYDAATGGCHDGLHSDRINENQGAESTIAFHLSLLEMQSLQNL
jgi:hypothetical protein